MNSNPAEVKVTVIINNRDLINWPKKMVERLDDLPGVHEIIIIDNGSTYRRVLEWYQTLRHRVIFEENLGHQAPWLIGIIDEIETDLYIVTDPDLDISSIPDDTISHLAKLLEHQPSLGKIGLSLATDGIPRESPYYQHVDSYERASQAKTTGPEGLIEMPVDTTFAIYDRRILRDYKICGMRTCAPYEARHEPWYVVEPKDDFCYYLDHVEGRSSSYRDFARHVKSDSVRGLYLAYDKETNQKVSTKWDSYLDVYEDILRPMKREKVDILEIGIQNGGSLEIWSRYFKHANTIIGCDINPKCANLKYTDPKISVITGNANSLATFKSILDRSQSFDIIIDDGSHHAHDVISSFLTYFPVIKPGGIYIVEDMHCAYWEEYGGGVFNERSSSAFFKKLMDTVNSDHFRDVKPGILFQAFISSDTMNKFISDNPIISVAAYNSMYVVHKGSVSRPRGLGKEVIAGNIASVDDRVLRIKSNKSDNK